MQAASAVQVTVRRFGVWNLVLCWMVAITLAVAAAWWQAVPDGTSLGAATLLVGLASGGAVVTLTLWRRRPVTLRWDAQRWHLTGSGEHAGALEVLELRVVLDLGGWMLLKCRTDSRLRGNWIPLQQRGLEPYWQPLRCALYAQGGWWMRATLAQDGLRA